MKILYQRRLVLVQLIRTAQRYWVVIKDPDMSVRILTDALPLYWLRDIMVPNHGGQRGGVTMYTISEGYHIAEIMMAMVIMMVIIMIVMIMKIIMKTIMIMLMMTATKTTTTAMTMAMMVVMMMAVMIMVTTMMVYDYDDNGDQMIRWIR